VIAEDVLAELRRRGVQVEARGDVLHVEAPRGMLSPELVQSLRQLKPELLRLLRRVAPVPGTVGEALGGVAEVQPSLLVAEVCAMPLEEFARAGLVVEVWSRVLGEAVVFASDNARLDPGELRPVYRAHELRVLLGLSAPGELRRIHEVKRMFRGTVTDASP
jgi:TubC N-terminal docking domain